MSRTPDPAETDLGSVTITRDFDAPRELIFAAFMDPEQFVQFWGPVGVHTPLEDVVIEPHSGGRFESVMVSDDGSMRFPLMARFVEVVEPELISFQENGASMLSTTKLIALSKGRTRMVISQTLVPPAFRDPGGLDGFNTSLDRLQDHLASVRGTTNARTRPSIAVTSSAGIRITRSFDASRERVFRAWTTPDEFALWFGGIQVAVPLDRLSLDVRPGGAWSAVMVLPDGNAMPWRGSYVEVDRPSRLVFTLSDAPGGGEEIVTVDLQEQGEGTLMVFTQTGGHLPAEQYDAAAQGWGGFLEVMADLVRE